MFWPYGNVTNGESFCRASDPGHQEYGHAIKPRENNIGFF